MKKLDWGHPLMMGSPLTMGLSYQMAAMKLLMDPKNQMKMWQSMMDPSRYMVKKVKADE